MFVFIFKNTTFGEHLEKYQQKKTWKARKQKVV